MKGKVHIGASAVEQMNVHSARVPNKDCSQGMVGKPSANRSWRKEARPLWRAKQLGSSEQLGLTQQPDNRLHYQTETALFVSELKRSKI